MLTLLRYPAQGLASGTYPTFLATASGSAPPADGHLAEVRLTKTTLAPTLGTEVPTTASSPNPCELPAHVPRLQAYPA